MRALWAQADLARGLPIVVALLWLAALALSRGRRTRTLAAIGITAAVAGALIIAARALLTTPGAATISADRSLRQVTAAAITTTTTSLGHLAVVVGVVGLVVGLIAAVTRLRTRSPQRPPPRSRVRA